MMYLDIRSDEGTVIVKFDPENDRIQVKDGPAAWVKVDLAPYRESMAGDAAPLSHTAAGVVGKGNLNA